MEGPSSPLPSRPERSVVERSAVFFSSNRRCWSTAALHFVISTGAPKERSGEICGLLFQQPSQRSTTTLPFVISTGAPKERSGEICGLLFQQPSQRLRTEGRLVDTESISDSCALRVYSALQVTYFAAAEIAQNTVLLLESGRKTQFPAKRVTTDFVNGLV